MYHIIQPLYNFIHTYIQVHKQTKEEEHTIYCCSHLTTDVFHHQNANKHNLYALIRFQDA